MVVSVGPLAEEVARWFSKDHQDEAEEASVELLEELQEALALASQPFFGVEPCGLEELSLLAKEVYAD